MKLSAWFDDMTVPSIMDTFYFNIEQYTFEIILILDKGLPISNHKYSWVHQSQCPFQKLFIGEPC